MNSISNGGRIIKGRTVTGNQDDNGQDDQRTAAQMHFRNKEQEYQAGNDRAEIPVFPRIPLQTV